MKRVGAPNYLANAMRYDAATFLQAGPACHQRGSTVENSAPAASVMLARRCVIPQGKS